MSKSKHPTKKSPWRFLFAGCALWGGLNLLIPLMSILPGVLPQAGVSLSPSEAASIGIIGGADGPTAILVTTQENPWISVLVGVLLLAVGIVGYLRLSHPRKPN